MHHTRLVGGLISLAALLTILLAPSVMFAEPSDVTPPLPGTTPSAVPTAPPTALPEVEPAQKKPRLTKRQRRERRLRLKRQKLMRIARRQLGVRYVYGGASRRGFDCSGFTMYVYKRLGFSLSHGATDQTRRGHRVSLHHLKPGDLVFYGGSAYNYHVAIYAGHARVIQAPHAGAVVSYAKLRGAATARRLVG